MAREALGTRPSDLGQGQLIALSSSTAAEDAKLSLQHSLLACLVSMQGQFKPSTTGKFGVVGF